MVNVQPALNFRAFYKTPLAFILIAFQRRMSLALPVRAVKDSFGAVRLIFIPTPRIAENAIPSVGSARGTVHLRPALYARVISASPSSDSSTLSTAPPFAPRPIARLSNRAARLTRKRLTQCDAVTGPRAKAGIRARSGRIEIGTTDLALLNCSESPTIHRAVISSGFRNKRRALVEGLRTPDTEHDHGPIIPDYCQLAQLRIEAVTKQGLLFT